MSPSDRFASASVGVKAQASLEGFVPSRPAKAVLKAFRKNWAEAWLESGLPMHMANFESFASTLNRVVDGLGDALPERTYIREKVMPMYSQEGMLSQMSRLRGKQGVLIVDGGTTVSGRSVLAWAIVPEPDCETGTSEAEFYDLQFTEAERHTSEYIAEQAIDVC